MRMLAIMLKDLRLVARDRSAFAFLLAVPIVVILVVAETASGGGTRSIVFPVVNEDQGPVANALIKVFNRYLQVREVTLPDARRLVAAENKAPAALILPGGMSKRYLTDKPSTIELLTDPAQWEALQAIKVVMLLADREAATLGDPFSQELLHLKEQSITGERLSFSGLEQHLPGFSLMFVLLTMVFTVSIGLREEEVWGTSARLSVAPMAPWAVLGGKLLARIVIGIAQLMVLLLFAHFVYGLKLGHSPLALLVVGAVVVFSMACFSVIVAGFARTREQAIPVGMSVVFLLAALGGLWWPFFHQPAWMQTIGRGAMTTWSMFAIQNVMLRDKSLADVSGQIVFLLAYGMVSFVIGLSLFTHGQRARR
jgi:linearmycin/streptolysin S transport system permease protein